MPAVANLVHQTSIGTGTGNLTLVAVNGKRSFLTAFGTGGTDTFDYFISNRDAAEWERGTGHESAGALVRDTVLESSNANAAVSFTSGTKDITNDMPALSQAPLASPAFTGTPTAPTAALYTNTTQLATTAAVYAGSRPAGLVLPLVSSIVDSDGFSKVPSQFVEYAQKRFYNDGYSFVDDAGITAWLAAVPYTFSRASTKSVTGSDGLLASVASGSMGFNHTTAGIPEGYLAEGAKTNLCLQSQTFNTTWNTAGAVSVSVSANATTAPDGTTTADKIVEAATNAWHYIFQSIAVSNATVYTWSVYAKYAGRQWLWLDPEASSDLGAWFDIQNGVLGTVQSGSTAVIQDVGNGWYRISVSRTTNGVSSNFIFQMVSANGSTAAYLGDGTSGVYLWGAQLETGGFNTSYIPTTTASVARPADSLTHPLTVTGGQLSMSVKFKTPPSVTGTYSVWVADDATTANYIKAYISASHLLVDIYSGSALSASLDMGVITASTTYTLSLAAKASSYRARLNGGTVVSAASGAMPVGITTLRHGCGPSAGSELFSTIQKTTLFNGVFAPDAALLELAPS